MTVNGNCPQLAQLGVGISYSGIYQREDRDEKLKIRAQKIIDACLECKSERCFFDSKEALSRMLKGRPKKAPLTIGRRAGYSKRR